MKKILLAVLLLSLSACTNADHTHKALRGMGFTNIEAGGHSWFGCADSDTFATKFAATNPAGQRVSGVVCSGWLKGATVRFD